MNPADQTVAQLMASLRQGDHEAVRQLFDRLYPELRRLAGILMRKERMGHTWQPTVLVNELYLELLKVKSLAGGESAEHEKQAFFRLSAFLMRRLLISHSRALSRRIEKVELDDEIDVAASGAESLANIEKLLAKLEAVDPRLRHVVELRVFQGYTVEEIAAHLDCSAKTVTRCWTFAQRWLRNALGVSP